MTDHPITPPPKLVNQWIKQAVSRPSSTDYMMWFATQAARWGADQELEACCEWLDKEIGPIDSCDLRGDRRPKPPSLKEQALERCNDYIDPDGIIRRALESLPS